MSEAFAPLRAIAVSKRSRLTIALVSSKGRNSIHGSGLI